MGSTARMVALSTVEEEEAHLCIAMPKINFRFWLLVAVAVMAATGTAALGGRAVRTKKLVMVDKGMVDSQAQGGEMVKVDKRGRAIQIITMLTGEVERAGIRMGMVQVEKAELRQEMVEAVAVAPTREGCSPALAWSWRGCCKVHACAMRVLRLHLHP